MDKMYKTLVGFDERKLWNFLEKWTQPDNEDAYPQWKKELDSIFMNSMALSDGQDEPPIKNPI